MPNIECTCMECGKTFYTFPSQIKRGGGKFCSNSCTTKHRNKINNPSKRPEVRLKISLNHADVSGENNPMYGKNGELAPSYIDGRNSYKSGIWRRIALANKPHICELCGSTENLHIHHKDKNRKNNDLDNLQVVCVLCHNTKLHPRSLFSLGRFIKEVV